MKILEHLYTPGNIAILAALLLLLFLCVQRGFPPSWDKDFQPIEAIPQVNIVDRQAMLDININRHGHYFTVTGEYTEGESKAVVEHASQVYSNWLKFDSQLYNERVPFRILIRSDRRAPAESVISLLAELRESSLENVSFSVVEKQNPSSNSGRETEIPLRFRTVDVETHSPR